jgi:hypothetical protein
MYHIEQIVLNANSPKQALKRIRTEMKKNKGNQLKEFIKSTRERMLKTIAVTFGGPNCLQTLLEHARTKQTARKNSEQKPRPTGRGKKKFPRCTFRTPRKNLVK